MKSWIGAAIVTAAVTLAMGVPIATAAPSNPMMQAAKAHGATDLSARRHHRRYHHHGYRTYDRPQPRYYARPYYYRPYPYSVPAPFTFGFAFGPAWW